MLGVAGMSLFIVVKRSSNKIQQFSNSVIRNFSYMKPSVSILSLLHIAFHYTKLAVSYFYAVAFSDLWFTYRQRR